MTECRLAGMETIPGQPRLDVRHRTSTPLSGWRQGERYWHCTADCVLLISLTTTY